jgi:hypothetical protein
MALLVWDIESEASAHHALIEFPVASYAKDLLDLDVDGAHNTLEATAVFKACY